MSLPLTLETPRLSLRPAGEVWLTALIAGPGTFTLMTGLRVAERYTESPALLRFSFDRMRRASERDRRWWAPFLFIDRAANLVVGMGGFKGPPLYGTVEVGYTVAPGHRGCGLATEATAALATAALKQPGVQCVFAHTLPTQGPSPRVLEKCGFVRAGEGIDPEEGVVWRWELWRSVSSPA